MNKYIRTLTIYYDMDLAQKEVPLFRGAVLKSLGEKANILFHNHTGDKSFRYAYPMIQYKRINGKAAIVCIEDGVDNISNILTVNNIHLNIRSHDIKLLIENIETKDTLIGFDNKSHYYRLDAWLPLNNNNYHHYIETEDLIDRISMLNKVLTANILSFLKGMGVFVDQTVEAQVTNIYHQNIINYKNVGLTAFDIQFRTNISIPLYIGLGKNASVGFGVIHKNNYKQ